MPNLLGYECLEPVTWTLQVEVLFYGLLLLLFLTGALNTPVRALGGLLVLSLVTCSAINWLAVRPHNPLWLGWMETCRELFILEYLPLFAIGMLLNEIRAGRGSLTVNAAGIAASAVVFHLIDRHDHNPAATLVLVALLGFSAFGRVPFLRWRPLVWVSSISYALYLLHNNLGCVFIWHVNQAGVHPLAAFVAGIVFVTAVSAFVTFRIERPLTAWLRNAWSARRSRLAVGRPVEATQSPG